MGYSGLIYAAIVAAWLAVLVPRWVRRNEEVERARETDAANGVRVLRRRQRSVHAPYRLAGTSSERPKLSPDLGDADSGTQPDAPARVDAEPAHGPVSPAVDTRHAGRESSEDASQPAEPGHNDHVPASHRAHTRVRGRPLTRDERALRELERSYHRAAMRRRRILALLSAVTGAVVLLTFTGSLPGWSPALSAGALVGFLTMARRAAVEQAQRRDELRRKIARRQRMNAASSDVDDAADEPEVTGKRVAVLDLPDPPANQEKDTWQPVDVPLPTYVTKPAAPRTSRKIDLSRPGSWTSGRIEPDRTFDLPSHHPGTQSEPQSPPATGSDGDAPEERRAVGE